MSVVIPAPDQELVFSILRQLITLWRDLDQENRRFLLDGETSAERLAPLIDQRDASFETSRQLEADLLERVNRLDLPGRPFDLAGAWRALSDALPALAEQLSVARRVLQALVESDKAVEARLQTGKNNLQAQIHEARRGARVFKGYVQADPMGSCFIDKVR